MLIIHPEEFVMRCLLGLLLVSVLVGPVLAQPDTDIYLVELTKHGATLSVSDPVNVTQREGYDNQPFFLPDGRSFLYTAMHNGQTDIYRYTLGQRQPEQMTNTPESEYSATPILNNTAFSVIRVEADQTQRLWQFPMTGGGTPSIILTDVKPVGYQAWGDEDTVGMFVLGQPPTFQIASRATGQAHIKAWNIGRSLHRIPGAYALSFVQNGSSGGHIFRYDLDSGAMTTLAPLLGTEQDYAWLPDGKHIITGQLHQLFCWNPASASWVQIADFSAQGLTNITRISISSDGTRLVFVAEKATEDSSP